MDGSDGTNQAGLSAAGASAAAASAATQNVSGSPTSKPHWCELRHLTGGTPKPVFTAPSWKLSSIVCLSEQFFFCSFLACFHVVDVDVMYWISCFRFFIDSSSETICFCFNLLDCLLLFAL